MVSYADGDLMCWNWDASFNVEKVTLTSGVKLPQGYSLLDMDGDGKIDVPCERGYQEYGIFHCKVEIANTPPNKMQAPKLLLDKSTGMLRAEWEHGTDAENSAGDLSYEFEITSPNGEYLFRTFTKSLFTLASAGSWGTSSVQARVRAIDGCGMKGKWSDVAKQDGILAVPSVALSCHHNASTGDTIFVRELSDMECEMKAMPDGRLVTAKDGRKGFVFASYGTKKIEFTAKDGITISRQIEVQPVRVESAVGKFGIMNTPNFCFDFAQLGTLQALTSDGYYKWNDYKYEKQPVFDFSDGVYYTFVYDANMDGLPDPAHADGYQNYTLKVAVNQGDGDFLKSSVSCELPGSGYMYDDRVDINNDGLMECSFRDNNGLYRIDMNECLVKTDYMDLGDQSKIIDLYLKACADFDRDGRLDIPSRVKVGNDYYEGILYNEGNGRWTFKPVSSCRSDMYTYDVDGDGYVDLVLNNNGLSYYSKVLRNLGNREFAELEDLDGYLLKMDIDQDGLADLQQFKDGSIIVSNHGSPVLVPFTRYDLYGSDFVDINNDGVPDCSFNGALMRIANNNTAPTAPTTLIAAQTADEVIISWDGATDKESTTSQLRYNISIKEKGATGDGAYIWSPLNANNDKARMSLVRGIPTYYRQATKLPMPINRFQAGKTYEICVQTIDPWYASSPFSKVIEFTPQAECHITLPAKAGVDEYVAYRTVSNVHGALSIRQAEGMDLSKNGYIKWNTPGVKTVVTTNTNSMIKSTTQILIVDKPNLDVQIPARALAGQTLVLDMPECMRNEGAKVSVTSDEAKVAYDANTNKAVVTLPEQDGNCQLTITYADEVWQKAITRNYNINVVGKNWTPQIAQVKVADGHCVIQWDEQNLPAPELFTGMVNIYRESDIADSYDLIAQVPMSQGKYVDEQSHSEVCSYRYQMTLSTTYGVETLPSKVHATMHVLANHGLGNDINIRWTPYEGTTVAQYVVYAGASPDNMQIVDRLSGYARSYVHHRNSDATTYYAVGFVAKSELSAKAKAKTIANDEIVSNIISSADAYNVNAVQSIEIATREEEATFTQERLTLHLLAYVTPSQASIGKVEWSLLAGESLVNLSDDGVMQLIPGTTGGEVIVQAKAIDGSGITATRTFAVPQVSGVESVETNADGVKISAMLGGVMLTGITNPTDVLVTTANGTVVYRSILAADHHIVLGNGLYIVRAGNRVGKVMVR
ncbi:MAG: VCBS repeat-containing protein [Prevotella sp.]|nr:VCBS repeat-containing protein [Prevotella sp.]MDY4151298.1 VCBS repeat-containing protein [Prevotella sp.]